MDGSVPRSVEGGPAGVGTARQRAVVGRAEVARRVIGHGVSAGMTVTTSLQKASRIRLRVNDARHPHLTPAGDADTRIATGGHRDALLLERRDSVRIGRRLPKA